jgi:hypothetical protein
MWVDLPEYAPPVAQLMQRFFLEAKIKLAILDTIERKKLGVVSAVCDWLKDPANEPTWSAWLPPQRYWVQCDLGYKTITFDDGRLPACEPCPVGTYSKEPYGTSCNACEPGYFAYKLGMASCVSCDAKGDQFYQENASATACDTCPEHTRRRAGSSPAASSECKCETGFWRHDQLLGRSCFGCPEGADCEGKDALPFPKKDYWAITKNAVLVAANTSAGGASNESRQLLVFDATGLTGIPITPGYFQQCSTNPARCKGGSNFECNPGYEGIMCSDCKVGQFYFRGACDISCSDIEPQGAVTVFGILAVIAVRSTVAALAWQTVHITSVFGQVWIILNKSAGGACVALSCRTRMAVLV